MSKLKFPIGKKFNLRKIDPADTGEFKSEAEVDAKAEADLKRLYELHYQMYAEDKHALVIILQGIDASGKDGTVRHLFRGTHPMGCIVHSFKTPSAEELSHDYLWRVHRAMPERGHIAIFNRSHYEEVAAVKVHPEYLDNQKLPDDIRRDEKLFEKRYEQINQFEKMLAQNGTVILKFFLHISKEEQKERFIERLTEREKHWKFNAKDVAERAYWEKYQNAFEQMIEATNTKHAPWYVIPADEKWYRNYLIGRIVVDRMDDLKMTFPKLPPETIKVI